MMVFARFVGRENDFSEHYLRYTFYLYRSLDLRDLEMSADLGKNLQSDSVNKTSN
jgi:hypothetical protein